MLSAARYWLPWFNALPPDFMAPVAAHCTSFGFLWILYHFAFFVHSSFDKVGLFFGLVIPKPPVIYIKNIKETGTSIYWTLPEKPSVEKYLIEINGMLAGESDKQETSVEIMGLSPDSWYKIRVWAVSNSRIRTPSQCIVIKTLPSAPVAFPPSGKVTKETPTNPLEVQDAVVATKTVSKSEENTQTTITEDKIDALRSECETVRKQRQEIAQNAYEAEKQSKAEEEKIRSELERLRALKRAEEEPKMKLKSRLKSLDDSKIEAEAARTKLERELKVEQNAKQHSLDALFNKEKEKEKYQRSLEAVKDKVQQGKEEFDKQKAELEESIKQFNNDISFAEVELTNVMQAKEELWNKIVEKKEELKGIVNENGKIAEPDNKLRSQTKTLDQEHRVLFQKYLQLQDFERTIKEQLQRLDHEKWTIMEELNKARRLVRPDSVYAGGYQLFGPAGGESLPEFSLSGPNEAHHPVSTTTAPNNYPAVGSGSFFTSQSEIPSTSVSTSTFPSTTSQPQSLFSGFTGAFAPSSGAVGEKRNINNPLRNLAINNNSAPDLLAVLGSGTIPNSSGYSKRDVNEPSNPPTSSSFRPRHRYQSSHGSVHSLFEYGPVGSIDDPIEYAAASVPSVSNMTPSRSATVSPEFETLAGNGNTLFPVVRSPSPAGTITPPSGVTNGRMFRGREFNFFGRSPESNEIPNSRPQLPSGILETVNGGTEFPSIKKAPCQ
ncbi:hypothetical protein K493DRAFT_337499 [Basidiobolus meristosporus CBS 931.73]|uniref:Fibronectin type-III domain-containing protein n=1 Tax=Basidiobolus meristosporus CBS 931.73 TaxID=1314790 RepID=A0A1Y1YAX7_9FUNG|nr:hypothetical protein K493DRAFT_337499 [Basidiobolus meristosporus CBS 931.73]|eukprot:ORX95128.1 hypothetical protein K493DRAFT_337499 [Basidiobolus meristosporus CBS 931.73]